MTVSSTTARVSYSGNGSTTAFSVTFYFLDDADLKVVVRASDGTETIKVLDTDYTVTGEGNPSGGTVTFGTAPASGTTIVIVRNVALTQNTDYQANDPFPAETHEEALDRLTMIAQQQQTAIDRVVRFPVTDSSALDAELPPSATRANKLIKFDASGNIGVTTENYDADLAAVAAIADDVSAVAAIDTNVTTVAGIDSDVTTVAGIAGNVTTVAGISADVTAVAGIDQTDLGNVADIAADVTTVAGIAADVSAVAAIDSDVTTVAADGTDIGTVSTNIASVNTVAGISGNVTTVAGISANVTTVAGISANVTTVAGIAASVPTVAGISADVTAVAAVDSDVTTVAGIDSDVTTVAGIAADVTTVATNAANISSVAADIAAVITAANDLNEAVSEIDTVATNIASVNTVGTNIADVSAVAAIAADVTTAATNVADITNFADVYIGPASSAPSTRADSSALQVGDLYFNTTEDQMKVYDGASWIAIGSTVNGTSARFEFTATSGQTTFTGLDDNGSTLAYDAGYIDVYLNGIRLDSSDFTASSGDSIVLASGAALNDELNVVAYGNFVLADHYTKAETDALIAGIDALPSQTGNAGKYLTTDGTDASWGTVTSGATGAGGDAVFVENDQEVTTNYTITTNKNAMSTGPITINSGVTVTVPTGSRWVVI
jgi:hypothetical protein